MNILEMKECCINALEDAYQAHERLGEAGLVSVRKNDFGDMALVGDIECENAVINVLKAAGLAARVVSEEHGDFNLRENPDFLCVIDGIDGTDVYRRARGDGRYGTMLAVFSADPCYEDYIFAGVMVHSTHRLYFAVNGEGSFVCADGRTTKIVCSSALRLDASSKLYADMNYDRNHNTSIINDWFVSKLEGFTFLHEDSSAIHYVDLAAGSVDAVLECTRKKNLEIAVAYGLVTEAGGVIVTDDGKSIAQKRYLDLGQTSNIPIISASSISLALDIIRHIKRT